MKPCYVTVHESGSAVFPYEDKDYAFEDFERLAIIAAQQALDDQEQTHISIGFTDGRGMGCCLNLHPSNYLNYQDFTGMIMVQSQCENTPAAAEVLAFLEAIEFTRH